jgi:transcriptional regulator with XRE-family HTH domain
MIGKKIREKRTQAGINLKELAQKTELTSGFLSQIERDIAEPSISSLRKIADVLGVALFYFFMDNEKANPVVKKSERKILKISKSKLTYELLCPEFERQMEMFICRLKPEGYTSKEPHSHGGEEVVHVLEGKMCIFLGDDVFHLEDGDTVYYFSSIPHRIINEGETELAFISSMTPLRFNRPTPEIV